MENKQIEIAAIGLEQVLEIRREVMWPDKSISFVSVSGDEEATHLGVIVNGVVVSIILTRRSTYQPIDPSTHRPIQLTLRRRDGRE